jgi:hypothetical protein
MPSPSDVVPFDELLEKARELTDQVNTDEAWTELWAHFRGFVPFGRRAFDAAVALLAGPSLDRQVGCHLLATLCNPDNDGWSHEAAMELLKMDESDPDVLWAQVDALSHLRDPLAVPLLRALTAHPDGDIRLRVAQALPSCETFADGEDLGPIEDALLALVDDEDSRVRDWSTFGLGSLLKLDGPRIRAALVRRLDDDDTDTHFEAVIGLARRRDHRVLATVRGWIEAGDPSHFVLEAAGWLADEALLEPLRALRGTWRGSEKNLESAIRSCDREQRDHGVRQLSSLLDAFDRENRRPDLSIAASCDAVEPDECVRVSWSGHEMFYSSFELIEDRAGGDPARCVQIILDDVVGYEESPR